MGFARASAGLFKTDAVADFDKLARVCMSLGTKLRITPQSRVNPLTLARANRNALPTFDGRRPWDRDDADAV
jgi:hypothetical protein